MASRLEGLEEVTWALDRTPREGALAGTLRAEQVRDGLPRGPFALRQRRVRARVFGEPQYECELVPAEVCEARPHVLAWLAWRTMVEAAGADPTVDLAALEIYSAYRSVALQTQVWEYRLDERRQARVAAGLAPLAQADLERRQRKWTAKPGQSAHHTGLALDLALYHQGKRESRRSPTYAWLARHAREYGFYPYLPEAWHWEYNPPGLVERVVRLREALRSPR